MWILPLALYLISFIIGFNNEGWYRRDVFHPALAIAIFASFIIFENSDRSIVAVSRTGLMLSRTALTIEIGAPCILLLRFARPAVTLIAFAVWRWRRLLCFRTLWRNRDRRHRPHHPGRGASPASASGG